ncbi:MAG: hypothetical protein KAT90_14885 [Gammaproteobacteria bacterium]|nr:hypothetical protein [Gammaproteobacteria bacterium]
MILTDTQIDSMTSKGWELHTDAFGDTQGSKKLSSKAFHYAYAYGKEWNRDLGLKESREYIASKLDDDRYSINLEWCGRPTQRHVLRWCTEWVACHEEYDSLIGIAETHKAERDILLEGGESLPCHMVTYEGLKKATLTYNKSLSSTDKGIVTSEDKKYSILVYNSVIDSRVNGDSLDKVLTFYAC